MDPRRRERGFERVGACGPAGLGLGKDVRLGAAWSAAAGSETARLVQAVQLRAGVLEIEVADRAWADALTALLPELAGRVASRDPGLGISRCRLVFRDDGRRRRVLLEAEIR